MLYIGEFYGTSQALIYKEREKKEEREEEEEGRRGGRLNHGKAW